MSTVAFALSDVKVVTNDVVSIGAPSTLISSVLACGKPCNASLRSPQTRRSRTGIENLLTNASAKNGTIRRSPSDVQPTHLAVVDRLHDGIELMRQAERAIAEPVGGVRCPVVERVGLENLQPVVPLAMVVLQGADAAVALVTVEHTTRQDAAGRLDAILDTLARQDA